MNHKRRRPKIQRITNGRKHVERPATRRTLQEDVVKNSLAEMAEDAEWKEAYGRWDMLLPDG